MASGRVAAACQTIGGSGLGSRTPLRVAVACQTIGLLVGGGRRWRSAAQEANAAGMASPCFLARRDARMTSNEEAQA